MSVESRELAIYAMNHADLYHQHTMPAIRNLAKHKSKDQFDRELAIRGMSHVTTDAAKRYHAEFGSPDFPWHKLFTVSDRWQAAEELLDHYQSQIDELS